MFRKVHSNLRKKLTTSTITLQVARLPTGGRVGEERANSVECSCSLKPQRESVKEVSKGGVEGEAKAEKENIKVKKR